MIYILQDSLNNIILNAYYNNVDQALCDMIDLNIKYNRRFIIKILTDNGKLRKSGLAYKNYYYLCKEFKTYTIYVYSFYKNKRIKINMKKLPEAFKKINYLKSLCIKSKKELIKIYKESNIGNINPSILVNKKEYIRELFLFTKPKIERKPELISLELT